MPRIKCQKKPWATVSAIAIIGLCAVVSPRLAAQENRETLPPKANVFVYPKALTTSDKLVDGPSAKIIHLEAETTFIWVDLAPDFRFAHPTEYVLISPAGTRVVKGHWWPVLNGKPLFRNTKPYNVKFPAKLVEK